MNMQDSRPLRLALPSGALGQRTREVLRRANLVLSRRLNESGQMKIDDEPAIMDALGCPLASVTIDEADIPTYVEHGVVDLGVVRTHVLRETDVEVYRPFTFDVEVGQMALVAPQELELEGLIERPLLRVATRCRLFGRDYFLSRGWNVELVPIAHDVLLAPLLGLADAALIFNDDPRALSERGLHVVDEIGASHAKLIANRTTGRKRMRIIERLCQLLAAQTTAAN